MVKISNIILLSAIFLFLGFSIIALSCKRSVERGYDMPTEEIIDNESDVNKDNHHSFDSKDFKIKIPELALMKFPTEEDALEFIEETGEKDRYMQGIIPTLFEENFDYAVKLLNNFHDYFIVVDKGRMKVILYDKYGSKTREYGMACAKNFGAKHKKRDGRTPEGFFYAKGVFDSTEWLFTDDDGNTSDKKGQFGPRFIRISPMIGIHGTASPWSIGHRTSHGCIRLTNENILDLVQYAEKGMPVIVIPGKRDKEVNKEEGYNSHWFDTSGGISKASAPEEKPQSSPRQTTPKTQKEEVETKTDSIDITQIAL